MVVLSVLGSRWGLCEAPFLRHSTDSLRTYRHGVTQIHIRRITAFSDVPRNDLMRKCCLIHLRMMKNAPTIWRRNKRPKSTQPRPMM